MEDLYIFLFTRNYGTKHDHDVLLTMDKNGQLASAYNKYIDILYNYNDTLPNLT